MLTMELVSRDSTLITDTKMRKEVAGRGGHQEREETGFDPLFWAQGSHSSKRAPGRGRDLTGPPV